jgi:hypothetical protein
MKIGEHARKALKARIGAGLVAVLLSASAQFWMERRFGHECGQITSPPGNEAPAFSDWLATT